MLKVHGKLQVPRLQVSQNGNHVTAWNRHWATGAALRWPTGITAGFPSFGVLAMYASMWRSQRWPEFVTQNQPNWGSEYQQLALF